MSFTLKDIFPPLSNTTDDELRKHRMAIGTSIRDSWKSIYGTPPAKVEEDGFQVCLYDDEFKDRAKTLVTRYVNKITEKQPSTPVRRRRRLIVKAYERVKPT